MHNVIRYLLFFIVLLLPFGQLAKIPLSSSTVNLYMVDIVVFILVNVWVISHLIHHRQFNLPPLSKQIALFIFVCFLSLSFSITRYEWTQIFVGALYLIRWIFYSFLYFIAYEEQKKKELLIGLLIAGTVSATFGLVQYFIYPSLRNLVYLGWDPHEFRIFSTFLDSGFAGIIYLLTFILLLSFLLNQSKYRFLFFISGALIYTSLLLTYSRSTFLAFFVSLLILSFYKKSFVLGIFSISFLFVSIYFLPKPSLTSESINLERTSTIDARTTNYLQTSTIIADHPLFGIGFNTLRYEKMQRGFVLTDKMYANHAGAGSDSSFLFVIVTTGVVGFFSYLSIWFKAIMLEKNAKNDQPFKHIVVMSIASLFIHSLFLNSLFYIWTMMWMWLLLGIRHGSFNSHLVSRSVSR
jgi:O-antigen ligase